MLNTQFLLKNDYRGQLYDNVINKTDKYHRMQALNKNMLSDFVPMMDIH